MVDVQKFSAQVDEKIMLRQPEQTQIRLLLKKQSDLHLPVYYSDKHFVIFSLDKQHFIRKETVKCLKF